MWKRLTFNKQWQIFKVTMQRHQKDIWKRSCFNINHLNYSMQVICSMKKNEFAGKNNKILVRKQKIYIPIYKNEKIDTIISKCHTFLTHVIS